MKISLVVLLVVIALAMVFISFSAGIPAPGLTGLGFLIIVALFLLKEKK